MGHILQLDPNRFLALPPRYSPASIGGGGGQISAFAQRFKKIAKQLRMDGTNATDCFSLFVQMSFFWNRGTDFHNIWNWETLNGEIRG